MRPIDYRNAKFADLQEYIVRDRHRVLVAWREHGPCTTEGLAQLSGIPLLTLRPRTTDLVQLGFVILAGGNKRGGVYRAATAEEVLDHFRAQQSIAHGTEVQQSLALNLPSPARYY